MLSRADRKVVEPVSLCYSGPGAKGIHASEKSEPMLRHFFRMFVDEYTELLDPTCGSGAALRAAESMKAKRCLGLEINSEFADSARTALSQARVRNQLLEVK
jgi:tRNA1(Val) A37 N6-methylase TrmN6